MEFGARALGNRSVLADPSDLKNVEEINNMIKKRDFWMPFAPAILDTDENKYIINEKGIKAPYMILSFDTVKENSDEIVGAIHRADRTARPQIVYRDWNPEYYDIISNFKKNRGIGAVLNTSFNLHGYPIVHGSEDALWVLENSGLKYLALGDYLVSK
jgi:carbamoyltransferase